MRFSTLSLAAVLLAGVATPAFAQDTPANTSPSGNPAAPDIAPVNVTPAVTITGGVTLTSDYRFRGTTQTNEQGAVQGTVNINTRPGFYAGVWASTIDGGADGSTPALTGYGDAEVDLYGGYTHTFNGVGVDVGLLYYFYGVNRPGNHPNTDFFEPYASLSYTIGPVAAKVGANYAWGGQDGLAGFDVRGGNDDNLYVYGEASIGIPHTPLTLKGHLGYSDGSLGSLNIPGSFDNNYLDWSVTAEAVGGPFKVGVSYVDTDISEARGTFSRGGFTAANTRFGQFYGRGATVLGYVGFSF